MFNLLPENLKDSIKAEYKLKRLITIFFFVVCIEGTFLIFLFPTWLVSTSKEKGIIVQTEQMNQFLNTSNINPAKDVIKNINVKLNVINSTLEYQKFRPIIDTIISKKISLISIDQFSFVSSATSSARIIVGGVSATRESLVSFVKRLEETKTFSKVDLPIGNLAKDKNIQFTIDLTI